MGRMFSLAVGLALLDLGKAHECAAGGGDDNNPSCQKMPLQEDAALLQLARVGAGAVSASHPRYQRPSKPFFGVNGTGQLTGDEEGAIEIEEDGEVNTYYLPGANIINRKSVKYLPPYRFYLMKRPTTDYKDASAFYKPIFPGKTFTVDIDFGKDGASCGCNLNFYLVDMPVALPGKDRDYYCDAQCFPDVGCCSEFDMNEGNMDAQQITNHACQNDWSCDGGGDPWAKTHPNDFMRGPGHTIDSKRPFTYSQKFEVHGGSDLKVITILSQDGREVVLNIGPGNNNLNNMLRVLERGMAFVTGYWHAENMNWLDGEECGYGPEHCNEHPAYISNWRITTNSDPTPAPAPPPSPSPSPSPSPGPGTCCWGADCSGCTTDPGNWCNQDSGACSSCSGTWCTAPR